MQRIALAFQTPEVKQILPVALLSGTLAEKIEKAAHFGAQGVEIMTTKPTELDPAAIRAMLARAGLQVCAVASGGLAFSEGITLLHSDPLRASQARLRLVQLIEFAGEVGAPLVTIGSFKGRLSSAIGSGQEILADILNEAANLAQRQNVRIVIEPLNRYETDFLRTAAETLAFIDNIGHPGLGLLLDTFHVNIEETSWTAPFELGCAAGRLWHVHLGDNNRLPPGQGLIDFAAIVATLDRCGYAGFLSAELLAKPDPDQAARQTVEYMTQLAKRVQ